MNIRATFVAALVLSPMFAAPAMAMECRDPWIAQAIFQLYRRMPVANTPTTEECDISHYNGGHWNNYGDLVGYIKTAVPAVSRYPSSGMSLSGQMPSNGKATLAPIFISVATFNSLPQRNANGFRQVFYNNAWYLVSTNGGNVVAQGGGNVLGNGSANLLGNGGANVVAQGGGNVVAQGGGNVVASGGGNVTIIPAPN